MKNFESFLAPLLHDYLRYRQSLGYSNRVYRGHLLVFDRYLQQTKADWHSLQPFFFLQMRAHLNMQPRSINCVFSAMRGFFHFLLRREHVSENPLQDIPKLREHAIMPFVFSPPQIEQLLEAVQKRIRQREENFLIDLAMYLAILLLARCGLRISEPLKAMKNHYRKEDGTLYIAKTKFKKQRLIPVPRAAMTEIENYLSVRKTLHPQDHNPYLLAGKNLAPLDTQQVRYVFSQAIQQIGLAQKRKTIGHVNFLQPTPHSLRHSFAVNTLLEITQRGQSPQHALPVLAAYLGHTHYKYTSVYLRVTDAQYRKNLVDFSLWQESKT